MCISDALLTDVTKVTTFIKRIHIRLPCAFHRSSDEQKNVPAKNLRERCYPARSEPYVALSNHDLLYCRR